MTTETPVLPGAILAGDMLDILIDQVMQTPTSAEEGLLLGHQVASVLITGSIKTLFTTLACCGITTIDPKVRELFMAGTAKAFDDLKAIFEAADGTTPGEVA